MKLDQFLAENGISRAAFAKSIGVSEVSVTRYIGGTRLPRPDVQSKIYKRTKGAVTPMDFMLVESAPALSGEAAQ